MKVLRRFGSRIIVALLSLIVMFSLVQLPVLAAADGVWVNGENILIDSDHIIDCGNGIASYDVNTNTLTLKNAQITISTPKNCGIRSNLDTDFNIILQGSNSIDIQEYTGILGATDYNMNISGGGSLDIKAKQNISNRGNITFDNVTITASSGFDSSIATDGNIMIKNDYDITCGGTYFGLNAIGNLIITESNVTARHH